MSAPATAPTPGKRALAMPRRGSPLRDAVDDARYHEVAMLALTGVSSRADIMSRTGLSRSQLTRILDRNRDRFLAAYERARTELLGNLQAIALDERRDALQRDFALQARARTVAARLLDEVEQRITRGVVVGTRDDGTEVRAPASARDLQVALGAARAFRDPAATPRGTAAPGTTHIAVFAPTVQQVAVIHEAFAEAGVALDDLAPVRAPAPAARSATRLTAGQASPAPRDDTPS